MSADYRKGKSLFATTSNSFSTGEGVTITPNDVSGLPTGNLVLTFDREVTGKVERIKGAISGSNFVVASGGRGYDGTTEQAHTSPNVEYIYNGADQNDAVDAFVAEHSAAGVHDVTKVVTPTGTQTLTNKTLTSPVVNVGSDAQGDVYFRNSSGAFSRLAPGTSGYFLKTQGAAADPVWAASTSGLVSTARARAYLGTAQDNLVSNSPTKVTLQSETYDPGSNFDSATNYRFVAPVTGFYLVQASVTYSALPTTDKSYGGHIYVNGSAVSSSFVDGAHTGDYLTVKLGDILSLSATDYVELYAHHITGANTPDLLADTDYTYLSISFIGT